MNRALRSRHRHAVLLLALLAALLFLVALRGRRPIPASVLPPAELLP